VDYCRVKSGNVLSLTRLTEKPPLHSDPRSFLAALRSAWRSLRRTPGFLAIAVSSLAIALGLATAVIAQIDTLISPRSPIPHADRLFTADYILSNSTISGYPRFEEMQGRLSRSARLDTVLVIGERVGSYAAGARAGNTGATIVTPAVLGVLAIRPRLGRVFASDETEESGVVIVTDEFWRSHFENSLTIGAATLTFDDRVYSVIGVLPPGVAGFGALFIPSRPGAEPDPRFLLRTREPASLDEMREALNAVSGELALVNAGTRRRIPPFRVHSVRPDPIGLRDFHVAMMAAAVFVLAIACANVSALMLARGVARRRNQALQLALGASRWDLLRSVGAEVAILVALGGAAGVIIAWWAIGILTAATPMQLTRMGLVEPSWSPRVYAMMLGVVVLSVGLASAGPAWYVTRIAPMEPLKDSSGTTTGRPGRRFQAVVVAELALAMVLLLGASLITKSARAVAAYDFGYDARSLVQVVTTIPVLRTRDAVAARNTPRVLRGMYRGQVQEFVIPGRAAISHGEIEFVAERLRSVPGVRSAAWTADDRAERSIVVSDATYALDSILYRPGVLNVGPRFFATLGLPIVAGRDFTDADRTGNGAVILDESGARRLFPEGNAVGRLVKLGHGQSAEPWIPVVGIAGNAVHNLPGYPELDPEPTVYVSRGRPELYGLRFVVRPEPGAADVGPVIAHTVRDLLPHGSAVTPSRWATMYDRTLQSRRYTAGIFATLGIASLILATAGLFGVLSYSVSQRMREFAVRVALGARRPHVIRLVLRDGLVMALGGTAVGAAIGMWAAFAVWEWLWGVYPVDAAALVVAEVVLLCVTMAASALPALRATRANPVDVMRAT
jgi:ABC-type lipoprotein release transport system permease subunit